MLVDGLPAPRKGEEAEKERLEDSQWLARESKGRDNAE